MLRKLKTVYHIFIMLGSVCRPHSSEKPFLILGGGFFFFFFNNFFLNFISLFQLRNEPLNRVVSQRYVPKHKYALAIRITMNYN